MTQNYTQLHVHCPDEWQEILIADLAEQGMESFMQEEGSFYAYGLQEAFNKERIEDLLQDYAKKAKVDYSWDALQPKNWNAEWEANFRPILIGQAVYVRGTFHPPRQDVDHELVIDPKMSFGTGHHDTTDLMIQAMMKKDLKEKKVLDLGCGTGILAIMAEKLKAQQVDAVDNNPVCIENTKENVALNQCQHIQYWESDVYGLAERRNYGIILANINRNVLLEDIPAIEKRLKKEGILFLSGFFELDIPLLEEQAKRSGLKIKNKLAQNGWACLIVQHT